MNDMIKRERLIHRLQTLISIDSPSLGERTLCDLLSAQLQTMGFSPKEDASAVLTGGTCGNLYTFVPGTLPLPPLLFCAHMDTVEPSHGKKMQVSEDGTITSAGRTVLGADDCAGLAVILEALTAVRESGQPHRPLELLFPAAEELYCVGSKQLDFSSLLSRQAYVFDLSGPVGSAACQAPTILSFRLEFHGRSAHAGFSPEDGIHTIQAAGAAIGAIPCGRVGGTTVNLGTIFGGTADNIVPDHCTLTGEVRSLDDAEALRQMEKISCAAKRAADRFGTQIQVEHTVQCKAYHTPPEHPVARRFAAACQTQGLASELCETFGGSDQNQLALHGIVGLVVATAMNRCHTCDEFTTVEELCRAANLALALMLSPS